MPGMSTIMSDTGTGSNSRTSNKLVWIGIIFGLAYYLIDSLMEAYLFQNGNLGDQLMHPFPDEFCERLGILVIAIAFGLYAHILFRREQASAAQARTAETFLTSIIDNIPGMLFIKDARELRFVRINPVGEKLLGLSSAEIIGKNDYDFFPQSQADFFTAKDREVLASGRELDIPEEVINTMALGRRWLHTRKVPIPDEAGQPAFLLGISYDVTEAKQAQMARQETEVRFQTLFDFAAEYIFVIDPKSRILQTNRYAADQSGYKKDEFIGKPIKEFFTRESQQVCDYSFPMLKKQGFNRADIEFVFKNGKVIQTECMSTAIPEEDGNYSSFLIILRDITEKMQAASSLVDSERRFRAIFNSSYHFTGLLDPDGTVLEANQPVLDFLGYRENEIVGKPFWEMMWRDVPAAEQQRIKDAIADAAQGKLVRYQVEMTGHDNRTMTIDFSLKPILDEHGETVLIIPEGRDITDRIQAEAERHRHQRDMAHVMRLSTMGEMASGMAHELNQPLAALVSYCGTALSLAETSPSLPEQFTEVLGRATEQAHRASQIIRHLREFVSKDDDHKQPLELDPLILQVIDFIKSEVQQGSTRLEHHPGCERCRILANRVQVEQVLINLLRNSLEALQGAGIDQGRLVVHSRLLPQGSIEVSVTDNGPGIDASMQGKLFEPFQTSKKSGMGMGLSISRSIIESHGGKLWVDESYTDGARLGFVLPIYEKNDGKQ
jgi:two-component system sensor kinase FixL